MKFSVALLALLSLSTAFADVVLSSKTDERFGGYWLDINATTTTNSIKISRALTLQRKLRVCLHEKSTSLFRVKQTPFLEACLVAVNKQLENQVRIEKPLNGLTIVFDMDETLLTNWHEIAVKNPEKTTLIAKHRDVTLSEKDLKMTMGPKGVTIRPGSTDILKKLSKNSSIANIAFFSAREDASAKELTDYFIKQVPSLKNKFLGLWARNSLRLDAETNTPSKDLRLLSDDLSNILLIDDNAGRVMQKNLNFTIPKFNADVYLTAKDNKENDIIEANKVVMPFVYKLIVEMTKAVDLKKAFYPYSSERAIAEKIDWGREIMKEETDISSEEIEKFIERKIFDQPFYAAEVIQG